MTLNSSIRKALAGFLASLGHLSMTLVAGEELRVRWAIARTVTRTRPAHGFGLKTRWGNQPDLAANSRVE
jgi:hypothetical protein